MKDKKPSTPVDLSPDNYHTLVQVNLMSTITDEYLSPSRQGRRRYAILSHIDRKILTDRLAPALIATGFFEKTSFTDLAIFFLVCVSWEESIY